MGASGAVSVHPSTLTPMASPAPPAALPPRAPDPAPCPRPRAGDRHMSKMFCSPIELDTDGQSCCRQERRASNASSGANSFESYGDASPLISAILRSRSLTSLSTSRRRFSFSNSTSSRVAALRSAAWWRISRSALFAL